ncbi:MAG: RNA polymerase sigma factor [Gemmatimonadetes bacterium]|nr:RNA polymerase sigma factor [Gemmatimonadota bacterium]
MSGDVDGAPPPTDAADDAALVDAILREGSEAACRILFRRHTPRMLMSAWRLVGHVDRDADDIVQDSWLRAAASLHQWRREGPLGAWLRGIVVHVALTALRRRVPFEPLDDADALAPAPDRELHLDLESAIRRLPPRARTVLVLHDVEGYTHDEIATRLGITDGASKAHLFKARRAVRAMLGAPLPTRTP